MKRHVDYPFFPVTDWQIDNSSAGKGLAIQFEYCTYPQASNSTIFTSQYFFLAPEKAMKLIQALQNALPQDISPRMYSENETLAE